MPTTEKLEQGIADAEEAGAGGAVGSSGCKTRNPYLKEMAGRTGAPPHYQRGRRGEHRTAGKGFVEAENGFYAFHGKGFTFAGSQGFVDGGGQLHQMRPSQGKGISIPHYFTSIFTQIKRSAGQSAICVRCLPIR